jgi:hypothetical protein
MAMTYRPIDLDYIVSDGFDEQPLASAWGKQLGENADYLLQNRLKRHVISYDQVARYASDIFDPPPSNETTVTGFKSLTGLATGYIDPDTIGLTFSTPPNDVICLPPVLWPLSSHVNSIKITLSMRALQAPVEVFAFATTDDGAFFGTQPSAVTYLDADGVTQFSTTATASDQYAEVGTSSNAYSIFNPVQVSIPISIPRPMENSVARLGETRGPIRIFICFHSTQGSLDYVGKLAAAGRQADGTLMEEGTYTYDSLAITPATKYNPGSFHRWIQMETTVPGLSPTLTPTYTDPFKHVIQLRPGDLDDPEGTDTAKYVCWPPLRPDSLWSENAGLNIWECGVAQIASITIEEQNA